MLTYIQGDEDGASLKAAGLVKIRAIPARGSWADASVALKHLRDPIGSGGVDRELWGMGELGILGIPCELSHHADGVSRNPHLTWAYTATLNLHFKVESERLSGRARRVSDIRRACEVAPRMAPGVASPARPRWLNGRPSPPALITVRIRPQILELLSPTYTA